ncbi:hypothetical protein VTO73DRAFT_12050 [Trametes versicolor]
MVSELSAGHILVESQLNHYEIRQNCIYDPRPTGNKHIHADVPNVTSMPCAPALSRCTAGRAAMGGRYSDVGWNECDMLRKPLSPSAYMIPLNSHAGTLVLHQGSGSCHDISEFLLPTHPSRWQNAWRANSYLKAVNFGGDTEDGQIDVVPPHPAVVLPSVYRPKVVLAHSIRQTTVFAVLPPMQSYSRYFARSLTASCLPLGIRRRPRAYSSAPMHFSECWKHKPSLSLIS